MIHARTKALVLTSVMQADMGILGSWLWTESRFGAGLLLLAMPCVLFLMMEKLRASIDASTWYASIVVPHAISVLLLEAAALGSLTVAGIAPGWSALFLFFSNCAVIAALASGAVASRIDSSRKFAIAISSGLCLIGAMVEAWLQV